MKKGDAQGFTLVEVLIAFFILSVTLLAMSSMVYSVMRATGQGKGIAAATVLAQDKMENLKNSSYAALASGSDTPSAGNVTYNRQWVVSTSGNSKTITISVSWTDRNPHTISYSVIRGE